MSPEATLDGIGQIHISVKDLPRIVEFYRDVLGMRFLFDVPEQSMAFFDCGGVRLYFGKPESEELRSNPLIYYKVSAISDTYRTLLDRGAEGLSEPHVVHATETTELWIGAIRDPEGNAIFLMNELGK